MLMKCFWECQKERDIDIDGRIILKRILRTMMKWYGVNLSGSKLDPVRGLLNMIMNLRVL
jgi:hypothetical protein